MNINLLYKDSDRTAPEYYYDYKNITQDLSLDTLFTAASKEIVFEVTEVKRVLEPDLYIKSVMQKVMLTPLHSREEIAYRQDIIKDLIPKQEVLKDIYQRVSCMLAEWDKLGRNVKGSKAGKDGMTKLITRIYELILIRDTLSYLKRTVSGMDAASEGLRSFARRLSERYSDEVEEKLSRMLDDISFFVRESSAEGMVNRPRITVSCNIGSNGRLADFSLLELSTHERKYRDSNSTITKLQNYFSSLAPDVILCGSDPDSMSQARQIEYVVVKGIVDEWDEFYREFEGFFDSLLYQLAFYRGAMLLTQHMKRYGLDYCYPTVTTSDRLVFTELKEFVMCLTQTVNPIGNTCSMEDRMLIIITGANQGGKSTFLRSIGIAQVMMQCGLPVTAERFVSGIFPNLFMHFTRREDSQMNSGRLDEELGRMNQIVEHIGPDSLVLLNESFATTTERDGSIIAYDIIRALTEAGVKVITVTHLLSFAQRMYKESSDGDSRCGIEFLSAERMGDGRRTYRMIQNVPELTSFGLDLYEEIIR